MYSKGKNHDRATGVGLAHFLAACFHLFIFPPLFIFVLKTSTNFIICILVDILHLLCKILRMISELSMILLHWLLILEDPLGLQKKAWRDLKEGERALNSSTS